MTRAVREQRQAEAMQSYFPQPPLIMALLTSRVLLSKSSCSCRQLKRMNKLQKSLMLHTYPTSQATPVFSCRKCWKCADGALITLASWAQARSGWPSMVVYAFSVIYRHRTSTGRMMWAKKEWPQSEPTSSKCASSWNRQWKRAPRKVNKIKNNSIGKCSCGSSMATSITTWACRGFRRLPRSTNVSALCLKATSRPIFGGSRILSPRTIRYKNPSRWKWMRAISENQIFFVTIDKFYNHCTMLSCSQVSIAGTLPNRKLHSFFKLD